MSRVHVALARPTRPLTGCERGGKMRARARAAARPTSPRARVERRSFARGPRARAGPLAGEVSARALADEALTSAAVPASDPLAGVAFGIAFALLLVITGGMGYVALREALDRNEERVAREEEERKVRVAEANRGRIPTVKTPKMTPSQRAMVETGGESSGAANRRERRRRERAGGDGNASEENAS